jgi:tetratricopeptide (TPR) repeat protein
MADIFVSYTKSDRDWAFWLGFELKELGHTPHIHEWEIQRSDSIVRWMIERHNAADHVLCVVSDEYLQATYSMQELDAALWKTFGGQRDFLLLVAVKPPKLPSLLDHWLRCELYGVPDEVKRERFRAFMQKREMPKTAPLLVKVLSAVTNIDKEPKNFFGRDEVFAEIDEAFAEAKQEGKQVPAAALYGLPGLGKSLLALTYADRHFRDYRATWSIKAHSESSMRIGLVGLGVRLQWVPPDEKEEPALRMVMDRLRQEGEGILLVFDDARNEAAIEPYLPPGGMARVLITSNTHDWSAIARPIEVRVWSPQTGANFLLARTNRKTDRAGAEQLSAALGGLPLAHAQAGAYCAQREESFSEYLERFAEEPETVLDDSDSAQRQYRQGRTVAKTFGVAIDQAAKREPAAESLIVHAAVLALDPIPLFLFKEPSIDLEERLASALARNGVNEVVRELRDFGLVARETITEERQPKATPIQCINLHRLVAEVARGRGRNSGAMPIAIDGMGAQLGALFQPGSYVATKEWHRYALMLPHVVAVHERAVQHQRMPKTMPRILEAAGQYLHGRGSHAQAKRSYLDSLKASEIIFRGSRREALGAHIGLADLLNEVRAHQEADHHFQHAFTIAGETLAENDPDRARLFATRSNILNAAGHKAEAEVALREAIGILQRTNASETPNCAALFNNLGLILSDLGRPDEALQAFQKAMGIYATFAEGANRNIATVELSMARTLAFSGRISEADQYFRLAIEHGESSLGPNHPDLLFWRTNFAVFLSRTGRDDEAEKLHRKIIAMSDEIIGERHPNAGIFRNNLADHLCRLGKHREAESLYRDALRITCGLFGRQSAECSQRLANLAACLQDLGRHSEAEQLYREAIGIWQASLSGAASPDVASRLARCQRNLATLLLVTGRAGEALPFAQAAAAGHENLHELTDYRTRDSVLTLADSLAQLDRREEAAALRGKFPAGRSG